MSFITKFLDQLLIGWINEFLSWGGFIPLSRMSYIIYLLHMSIMAVFRSVFFYNIDGSNMMLVSMAIQNA